MTTDGPRSGLKNGLILTAAVLAAAASAAGPMAWFWGAGGLRALAWAAALCLAPGWLVFAFHSRYGTAAPVGTFLVGTGGRMAFVLCGALAIKAARPGFGMTPFVLSLGLFYLLTLALETKLLLTPPARGTSAED